MKQMYDKQGRPLFPVQLDQHTVVLVPKKNATKKYAEQYRKRMEASQKKSCNLPYKENIYTE